MESPISRSYINDITFSQMIKAARKQQMKETLDKIGAYNGKHREEILDLVLENTSKFRVRDKFKALKNAGKSL